MRHSLTVQLCASEICNSFSNLNHHRAVDSASKVTLMHDVDYYVMLRFQKLAGGTMKKYFTLAEHSLSNKVIDLVRLSAISGFRGNFGFFDDNPCGISGRFTAPTGSKLWGFGVLRAKKTSFTLSRDGISRHASGPEIDPKFRARRDSVSADREPGRFCPGGAETPWFWGRAT